MRDFAFSVIAQPPTEPSPQENRRGTTFAVLPEANCGSRNAQPVQDHYGGQDVGFGFEFHAIQVYAHQGGNARRLPISNMPSELLAQQAVLAPDFKKNSELKTCVS